jgi:DNA-binding response OmpR family regulator
MGFVESVGRRWVDNRFRSAFLLLTKPIGPLGLAARIEAFDTRNHGSDIRDEYDDSGWAAMLAGKREFGRFTGLVELLHVSSKREDRAGIGLDPRQHQTQVQAEVRMRW